MQSDRETPGGGGGKGGARGWCPEDGREGSAQETQRRRAKTPKCFYTISGNLRQSLLVIVDQLGNS
jgi:hypothetical protein